MVDFLGTFKHQIDAKGRISLPALFRRGHEAEPFVLIHVQPHSLSLYPAEEWKEFRAELKSMKRREEYRDQVIALTASAVPVVPDKQGRILIPERLRDAVDLGSEALVVGALDHIEIWDPERFASSTSVGSEEFKKHVRSLLA